MRNIAVTIEYDGSAYCGWQIQENGITVQGCVERALRKLTGEDVHVSGCSRTDAGVHAHGFVLNFKTESTVPAENFALAMNAFLPDDIKAWDSREVQPDFHARFDAKKKTYRYLFYPSVYPSALLHKRAWHIRMPECDLEAACRRMDAAAKGFIGFHDFTAFRAVGSHVITTKRTIFDAKVSLLPKDELTGKRLFCFEVSGDGFLYNMVRIMVGTLTDVMMGRKNPAEIPQIIQSKERKRAGMTAPPEGLYLYQVEY